MNKTNEMTSLKVFCNITPVKFSGVCSACVMQLVKKLIFFLLEAGEGEQWNSFFFKFQKHFMCKWLWHFCISFILYLPHQYGKLLYYLSIQNDIPAFSSIFRIACQIFCPLMLLESILVWPLLGENMLEDLLAVTVKKPYKTSLSQMFRFTWPFRKPWNHLL